MTDTEARELLVLLQDKGSFFIRNQDGGWGIRYQQNGYVLFSRVPYEDPVPDEKLSEAEVLQTLRGQSEARIRAALG